VDELAQAEHLTKAVQLLVRAARRGDEAAVATQVSR
jgi:hypothetical protein